MNLYQRFVALVLAGIASSHGFGAVPQIPLDNLHRPELIARSEAAIPSVRRDDHLLLSLTGEQDQYGALKMSLKYVSADGQVLDEVEAVSGIPSRQHLRTVNESESGSYEPVPQGKFRLGKPEWNPSSWGENLGPLWIDVYGVGSRSAIGIHLDANRDVSPGTAGCIGLLHPQDVEKVMSWWSNPNHEPEFLIVDYGLGSVAESSNN